MRPARTARPTASSPVTDVLRVPVHRRFSDLDPLELGEAGSLFLTRPRLADHLADAQTLRRRAGDVFALLASGDLKFQIAQRYTLDTLLQAHQALEARRTVGKAVLDLPHDS